MFPDKTDNPCEIFGNWLAEFQEFLANNNSKKDYSAMCLSTANKQGVPSSRMVLLKDFDENGFVFYTNYNSKKAHDLAENPHASLCFYWEELGRQVRVNGSVKRVSGLESDEYFATRARKSKIGAWASKQSSELEGGMKELVTQLAKKTAKFGVGEIPRPEFWGGYRVEPKTIEFWDQGEFRIHKRIKYSLENGSWAGVKLYP